MEYFRSRTFESLERSSSFEQKYPRNIRVVFGRVLESFQRGVERVKSLKTKQISTHSVGDRPKKESGRTREVFDPQDQFLQTWNKIFVLSCVISVAVDPLFFYIPVMDKFKDGDRCLNLDNTLAIFACVIRSAMDAFYAIHILFRFNTAIFLPESRGFGRGGLIKDRMAIAKRYLFTGHLIIDILSILPLPQVVVFVISPKLKTEVPLVIKEMLKFVIFSQYVPRLWRIYPLYVEVTRTSGILTETAWAGAAYNLFLYMLASHEWCKDDQDGCQESFYCGIRHNNNFGTNISQACPFMKPDEIENSTVFNFGIFTDVLRSGVVESRAFPKKFSYCFWWGLRSLSSFGQSLSTSTYVWEIAFAVFIAISGLVLFSLLIGNMQKYLQSTTVKVEEMRVRRTDAEQWMSQRMLPDNLRERVRRYEQYKWQETRGVEEENLIRNLPKDLRRDIKRHLCLDLLMGVPMFKKMDQQLWDPLVDRLKPVLYTDKSYIVREGDPVDEMLFIIRGKLATSTTNGGRTGFFNSADLNAGDFCGEELLTWALDPQTSAPKFPTSTRTVEAKTEVEAFALMAEDLKTVASQFRKLRSKELRHTFRFYSQQWKTWAACFIQSAWRRHCKRKLEKELRDSENRLQDALANEAGTSASLGATIYASRFAANVLRTLKRKRAAERTTRAPQRVLQLLPQKPTDPDFTAYVRH
ncbi:cyclic nucleotide-gated ion channel 1-like isoform X2 [Juglans microcarpa x Juglans regia]|uniref:cyclic nucleotide-gated ion channel 1-like isoform X2 n=1 Tax=Juglans microcarpa x Juglans regia TaxID=2249226 RepID=UPI001B7E5D43|nr:cyclic nucleotide-gated ion channel 1-like isoform X2 [Juglans microcarpa x Juglans regia]